MSLDTDAVIELVAREHGIFLSKNDPLLSLLAVNDIILDQHSNYLTSQIIDVKEHLESITSRYQVESKAIADVIVGQTVQKIQSSGKDIQDSFQKLMFEERLKHKQEIEVLMSESRKLRNQSYYAGLCSGACALFTIVFLSYFLVAQ